MIEVSRETHELSPEIQEVLTRAGGVNRYGEPNFRIVWNWSRLGWIGGWWSIRNEHGEEVGKRFEMRQEPKWLPPWDRWILETYRPAEWFGSPWLWQMQTTQFAYGRTGPWLPALGPYPARGDYVFVTELDDACAECWGKSREPGLTDHERARIVGSCGEREFLQATPHVAATLARMVMRNRERNWQQIREEIEAIRDLEERLGNKMDERFASMVEAVELTPEQKQRIERLTAPRIELQLAATQKRLAQMTPEMKRLALSRSGRAFATNLDEWIN